jgi:hypothetical protein
MNSYTGNDMAFNAAGKNTFASILISPNFIPGFSTTTTAAGTTTLTVTSNRQQFFTGSTTQTVVLPVVSTLSLGHPFRIVNRSTGAVTVNSSGGNAVIVLAAGTSVDLTCILITGTSAASWDAFYNGVSTASGKVLTISGSMTQTVTDGSTVAFGAGGTVLYNGGALGTPSSGTGTNLIGIPISTGISGLGSNVATFLATPTGANFNTMIPAGVPIVQNSQSTAYTTVMNDCMKSIYHPSADTSARTWTIDSNANVAAPIGCTITFINDTSAGVITIAITSDTLVLAGAGTTGSRTLAANGVATATKVTSTRWIINGTGLT